MRARLRNRPWWLRGAPGWFLAAYALARLGHFHPTGTFGPDTAIYQGIADSSLFDIDFFRARYPWATPLLWKLLPGDHLPAIGQLVISTAAWAVLAFTVAGLLAPRALRFVALALILAFSLVMPVTVWNGMLLSESLSISLFVLLVSAWIVLLSRGSGRALAAVLLLTLLWSFTRDSNTFLAMMTVPALLVWLVRARDRRVPAVLLAGTCAIAAASLALANEAQRHALSLHHVVTLRLVKDAEARAYFADHGLPRPPTPAYWDWLKDEGDRVYFQYLVTHPDYAIGEPLEEIRSWLSPRRFGVGVERRLLPVAVEELLYPPETFQLYLYVVVLAVLVAFLLRRRLLSRVWWVPAALVVLAVPHGMVVWLGDAADVDRHEVLVGIQSRLGVLLLALLAADRLLSLRPGATR